MTHKIIFDPVTRSGELIKLEIVIEGGKITDAKCSGGILNKFQGMLKGRSPIDTVCFSEDICGVCSTSYNYVSSLAIEDALDISIDKNSGIIRDLIHGCEFLQSHIRHFYAFIIPDYIKGASINSEIGEISIDYRLPYDEDERLSSHCLEGLKYSSMANQILAVLQSKTTANHGIILGGSSINIDASQYVEISSMLKNITDFVKEVMLEDVSILSGYYSDYFKKGSSGSNFLSYGAYDQYYGSSAFYVNPSVMINGRKMDFTESKIYEDITYSWYEGISDSSDSNSSFTKFPPVNLADGIGQVFTNRKKDKAYSFVVALRYAGAAMEVGPLSRMFLSGSYTRGNSSMDRIVARVLECYKIATIMQELLLILEFNDVKQNNYEIPAKALGVGLRDIPKGALGHWISIENKRIKGCEILTPSSWNLGPRDSKEEKGVVEKALIGTYIEDERNPIEIGRIIRSFDPCVSCTTLVITSKDVMEFQAL